MTEKPAPRLHHVVFCTFPDHQERAANFWRELGLVFQDIALSDLGLRVLIDWQAGIEVVAPTAPEVTEAARFTAFLEEHGEGVYSVVLAVPDVEEPAAVAARYGSPVLYQQRREYGDYRLDEAMVAPVQGMPVTFLATNRIA